MNKKSWPIILGLCVFMAIMIGLSFMRMSHPTIDKQALKEQGAFIFDTSRQLPTFTLIDNKKNSFDNSRLMGKWSLVYFGFTRCPDMCPTAMATLKKVSSLLSIKNRDQKMQYILVSVDSDYDTPEKMDAYVASYNQYFIGVTGESKAIEQLATQVNVPILKEKNTVDHGGEIVIINPRGEYYGFLRSPQDSEKIAELMPMLMTCCNF